MVTSESQMRAAKKWRDNNPEAFKESVKRWQLKNPDKLYEYQKKWRKKNPAAWSEIQYRSRICKILRDHKDEMEDDPDRLRTDFIIDLINKSKR